MKQIVTKDSTLQVPAIGLGCMRITELDTAGATALLDTALDLGINFFDHADIYAGGEAESMFAKAANLTPSRREKMLIQSKCGIRPGVAFDFSKEHILSSVDGILKRLGTDYLDILLLHRPDTLLEPEEVAEAFTALKRSGKVRHFGMSNQNAYQIDFLQEALEQPILFNQLQFSIAHCPIVDEGLNVNLVNELGTSRSSGTLEYCRKQNITIQAWSPFQYGFFEGVFLGSDQYPTLNQVIGELAEQYGVSDSAIAVAWILRHPARIQTIVGTTNKDRLQQIATATQVELTREEWYRIYMAAGKKLP